MESVILDSQERSIVYDILNEVFIKENCNELDLSPLSNSIDPKTLNTLATENNLRIRFEYLRYVISIENGTIIID